jgi:diguanylate cyclase (GGDEF)-like protein
MPGNMVEKTQILVADNNPVFQDVLQKMLSSWGYEVILAGDGPKACALLQADDGPRMAILASSLPGMDAVEICRRIRSLNRLHYVYLLLLTEKGATFAPASEELLAAMDAGADDYITRPFHSPEFRARLQVGRRIVKLQERLLRAHEELYEQATRDSLTGLWNRIAIIQILDSEIARATRAGTSLGVIMADIDHFKHVNDTYGHLAGDTVLREATARMSKTMRKYDSVGRYGGEEFLVVIPGCQFAGALAAAERLREAVGSSPYAVPGGPCSTSGSFGLAWTANCDSADPNRLLWEADSALCAAKRAGRNRVETFDAAFDRGAPPAGSNVVELSVARR